MLVKTLKFKDSLAKLILAGEKDSTWRLFDDKDLRKGDSVKLINSDTGEVFAHAVLTEVREKKMGELEAVDFEGHEKYSSEEEMYQTYRGYYGDKVDPKTVVKIIRFKLS